MRIVKSRKAGGSAFNSQRSQQWKLRRMKLSTGIAKMQERSVHYALKHYPIIDDLALDTRGIANRQTMTMCMQFQIHALSGKRCELLHGHQTKKRTGPT